MLLSKNNRLLSRTYLIGLLLLLSACNSVQKLPESAVSKPTQSESDRQPADQQSSSEAPIVVPSDMIDPMADIQINAEIKKAYKNVAELNKAKKYPQAVAVLAKIKAKYPQLSGPDYQLSRIYFGQNKLDKALEAVDKSIQNNARNYYSLNLKGVILREKGLFEESKDIYLSAIAIYPPYPNSHLNLGVLSDIYMGNLPLALLQYKTYMTLTSNKDKNVANWIIEIERRIKAGG